MNPAHTPITEDDIRDMRRLREEGKTLAEIAEYIGCSHATVWRYVRKGK